MTSSTVSTPQPMAPKHTPGTSRDPGSNPPMNASTKSFGTMPDEIIAFHSPMLCPPTTSGTIPSRRSTRSSTRPTSTLARPWPPSTPVSPRSGSGRPKCAQTSSTRGSNLSSSPQNRNASRPAGEDCPGAAASPGPASSGSGVNQRSLRPRHGVPRATIVRASASRRGVGATRASRQGPPVGAVAASSRASSTSSGTASWAASSAGVAAASSSTASAAGSATRPAGATVATAGVATADAVGTPVGAGNVAAGDGAGRSGACSRTACALMPPKPKAFTPARRGAPLAGSSQGEVASTGANRVPAKAGCGSSQCSVGGSVRWCSARAALISPAAPAAGIVCPIMDLTEPMPIIRAAGSSGPNTSARVASSAASPFGVAVPCASISPTALGARGSRPASAQARRTASVWPAEAVAISEEVRPSLATPVPRTSA